MGGIIGGGKTASTSVTRFTSLQVQTSAAGVAIALGWGSNRTGTNLLWYGDFQSHEQSQGGKGGGGGGKSYSYTTAVIMGLGEGPIVGVGRVWSGKDATTLDALNLTLMTGTPAQAALSWVDDVAPGQALAYPYTAYVASPRYDLGSSASLPNHNFEVFWGVRTAPNGLDANPADILADLLTNPRYGTGLAPEQVGDLTSYQDYCTAAGLWLSPLLSDQSSAADAINRWASLTNTAIFWSGGQIKAVPLGDQPLVGNGARWDPDLTPVYDLTDDDFLADAGGDDPVTFSRGDVADASNVVQVEYLDRANAYQTAVAAARDQAAVDAWGQRIADPIQAHDICDGDVAALAAQLVLQRQLYVRNTYTFKLGWRYGLLEPGDIVTLTDAALGLDRFPVRLTQVDEDADGTLSLTAEELPAGIGTATAYPRPATANTPLNTAVAPGPLARAVICEPSPGLTGGVQQVWIGAAGASQWWGGAHVWLSLDDETYQQIGAITAPARVGSLTTDLPMAADPDTLNTPQVALASGRTPLAPATPADADAGRTLALIGSEMVAYAGAALQPGGTYRLSYLRRGMYGTAVAAHPAGSDFLRLDERLFKYDLPSAYVGQRLYIKLTGYNLFGAAEESLADVDAYTYTPVGAQGMLPPPTRLRLSPQTTVLADGTVQLGIAVTWDAPDAGSPVDTLVRWQAAGATDWQSTRVPSGSTSTTILGVTQTVAYTVQAASSLGPDVRSNWTSPQTITLTSVLGGASVSGLELYGQGLDTTFTGRDVHITWRGNFPATSYDLGSEPYGAGSGIVNPYFRAYEVQVIDPATGQVVRSDLTTATDYVYTFQANSLDGGPRRTLTFAVSILDKLGGQTPAAAITVTNPPPAPLQVQAMPTPLSVLFGFIIPAPGEVDALDYAGVNIWVGATPDAINPDTTPDVSGAYAPLSLAGLTPLKTYYYRTQTVDSFGAPGCPVSGPAPFVVPAISAADLAAQIIGRDQLAGDLGKAIDLITDPAQGLAATSALIKQVQQTQNDADSATAEQITTLQTKVGANTAAVQDVASTVDGLTAERYIKVDSNGHIAGIGAYADPTGSILSFLADRFAFYLPGANGGYVTPFAIGTVNGQPTIVLNGAVYTGPLTAGQISSGTIAANVVYAGTITAAQITAGTLQAEVVYAGAITAGQIQSGSIGTVDFWSTANGQPGGAGFTISGTQGQMSFSDGARTRVLVGRNGGDVGIWTWDAAGNPVIVGGGLANNVVNTSQMVDGAVTAGTSVQAGAVSVIWDGSTGNQQGPITLASASMSTGGYPVRVLANVDGKITSHQVSENYSRIEIQRDGVPIYQRFFHGTEAYTNDPDTSGQNYYRVPDVFSGLLIARDVPPAGVHTYAVVVYASSGGNYTDPVGPFGDVVDVRGTYIELQVFKK